MKFPRVLFAVTGALVTALLVAVSAGPASAAVDVRRIVLQDFYADSGDQCPMGVARGTLGWHTNPTRPAVVEVQGVVVDQPVHEIVITPCADDQRYTIATFVAYFRDQVVDKGASWVDNGTWEFDLQLVSKDGMPPFGIDRVEIQVCRYSLPSARQYQPNYCGKPVVHHRPLTIGPTA